ncbi:hypothetical protein RIF29_12010 [Crotalaria pallida]|uniref:Uncharacterized protein n=1 Tax=Crotalaria pallida TaxID=3830 RepID=A0AAN9IMT5_CROPI
MKNTLYTRQHPYMYLKSYALELSTSPTSSLPSFSSHPLFPEPSFHHFQYHRERRKRERERGTRQNSYQIKSTFISSKHGLIFKFN